MKRRRLVSTIKRIFVDEITVTPTAFALMVPPPPLKQIVFRGKRFIAHLSYNTLCAYCGDSGTYVDRRGRYAECGHCGHIITSLRTE